VKQTVDIDDPELFILDKIVVICSNFISYNGLICTVIHSSFMLGGYLPPWHGPSSSFGRRIWRIAASISKNESRSSSLGVRRGVSNSYS